MQRPKGKRAHGTFRNFEETGRGNTEHQAGSAKVNLKKSVKL